MTTGLCKNITGVALILKKDGRILLYQRNIKGKIGLGMFALPGGTVEYHETVKQTACREAEEELGIKIAEKDLVIRHIFRLKQEYDEVTKKVLKLLTLFVVEVQKWEGEPQNMEPHKHSDLDWFDTDNIPENMMPLNLLALEDIKNGVFYNEHGF